MCERILLGPLGPGIPGGSFVTLIESKLFLFIHRGVRRDRGQSFMSDSSRPIVIICFSV